MKFKIFHGMGGGFGGASYDVTIECKTKEEAEEYARSAAIEDYQMYEGCHGILSQDDIFEDFVESFGENPTEEEVETRYMEEIESWIVYYVEELKE